LFLERADALGSLSAFPKYLGDTGSAGISIAVSPDISYLVAEASAGTSVGCRLSPRSSEYDVFDCGARCSRANKLRFMGFSDVAVFLERFRLKHSHQINAAASKTVRALATPIPAAWAAVIPELEVFGPGNILLLGRVIANKFTLLTASSVKTACETEKLCRS